MSKKSAFKTAGRLYVFLAMLFLVMAGCGPDPFFIPVSSIEGVPGIGTVGIPLALTGTVRPGFANKSDIVWLVSDAGTTGAVISGNVLNADADGAVLVKAVIANGMGEGKDFAQNFSIVFSGWLDGVPPPGGPITSPTGIELVYIPAGTFTMGSPDSESGRYNDEGPQHTVTLTAGFYMGKYQVTQDQYRAIPGGNGGPPRTAVAGESETPGKLPIEWLFWYDALVFCNKLSVMEGLSPAYNINGSTDPAAWGRVPTISNATWNAVTIVSGSNGYRLPTEAQWEYACRAGTTTAFNDGNNDYTNETAVGAVGWYTSNSGHDTHPNDTHQVGLKTANAWGLYDMHGNVWEFCWDWYGTYAGEAQTDPVGASSGTNRVYRGGSMSDIARALRSARRGNVIPYGLSADIGFRLVRPDISAAPAPTYGITLDKTGTQTFTAATFGYGAQTPLSVTVTNTGNQATGALTAALSGTNASSFTLSTTSISSIAVSGTGTFTVAPRAGLAAGTYTATVTVSGGNGITANFNVSFTVNAASGSITSPQGIELVYVPAGTFTMGSPTTETYRENNETQHLVTLTKSFYMGKYQVTQDQYRAVMGAGTGVGTGSPSNFTAAVAGESGTPGKLPVERVNWYDALVFCNKLSMMEGLDPAYSISGNTNPTDWGTVPTASNATWNAAIIVSGSTGYRLPTEAQWEYACRAGTITAHNNGDAIINVNAAGWYDTNSESKTHQVGLKTANAWGLHDMHGNVWEWCWDLYGTYASEAQADPAGASSGTNRVERGGGWNTDFYSLRSATRGSYTPSSRSYTIGFRLVRPYD